MPVLDIDDDDSPLDARGMLKDGRTFRVRMHARQRAGGHRCRSPACC